MADQVYIDELERRVALAETRVAELQAAEQALRESEERQAYFLALSDALRPLADQETIQAEAMRLLGEKIGVNRAQYYIADETGEYLSSSGGYSNDIPAAIGQFHLIDFGQYAYDGFHAGQTQVVSDATTDPRISEAVLRSYEELGLLAYIGVPFIQRGRLVGTLAVHQSQPRQWTENERLMVEETAERAGIAVEQARAESALRESQERQTFLLKLSDALRPLADSVEIQRETTHLLGEYLGVDRCYYVETDHQTGEYIIYRDFKRGHLRSLAGRHPIDQWPEMTAALSRGEILVVDHWANSADIPPNERRPMEDLDVRAVILVPLVKQGLLVACIAVIQSVPREWKSTEAALVAEVAERTWAAVERARAEASLRESEERFRQFANASAAGLWMRNAETLDMEFVSPAVGAIHGVKTEALLGDVKRWAALIVPDDREIALRHLASARDGQPVAHEFRIRRPSDGAFRWVRNTDFPLRDGEHIPRIGGITEDITEAKLAVEHQAVLLAELQHRVRNIMAMIRSVTQRTARNAQDVADYAALLSGRLMSLARTQALLTRAANVCVDLASLLHTELSAQANDESQYSLSGPPVGISPQAAEVLSLAVHELATNALKYGALSIAEGRIDVVWRMSTEQDRPVLRLQWTETRPTIANWTPPTRRGFGSELVERRVPYELDGEGKVELTPEGARVSIAFPLQPGASILETSAPVRKSIFGGSVDMSEEQFLTGLRILVIEDDYLLACDAQSALESAGATVVGPFRKEGEAIEAIRHGDLSAALTDINLGQGPSFEVAKALQQAHVPFAFLTGYGPEAIPQEFAEVPRFIKPIDVRRMIRDLSHFVQNRNAQAEDK